MLSGAPDNAHLRRYFFEAAICRYPVGVQGLMRIRAIYAADQAVSRAPATERQSLRERHVRPLATGLFDWARGARAVTQGRNLATKALGYAVNQEDELMRVLDDSKLPLDNTRSERALRKIVVGRNYVECPIMRRTPRSTPGKPAIDERRAAHNQSPSRNARRSRLGLKRVRGCVGGATLSRARCFIARSAST